MSRVGSTWDEFGSGHGPHTVDKSPVVQAETTCNHCNPHSSHVLCHFKLKCHRLLKELFDILGNKLYLTFLMS